MTPDNKLVEALRELRDVNLAIYASGIRAPDPLRSLLDAAIGRAGTALSQPVPSAPIDMVLHCPKCGEQHVDAVEITPTPVPTHPFGAITEFVQSWTNPPHKSHLCHNCGHIWRPADVPTNGVAAVKTKGKEDSPIAVPSAPEPSEPVAWLIEIKPHGHAPQWWGFNYEPGRFADWCADANNAVRFSRKEDAERMRLHILARSELAGNVPYASSVIVTEHMWPAPSAPASAPEPSDLRPIAVAKVRTLHHSGKGNASITAELFSAFENYWESPIKEGDTLFTLPAAAPAVEPVAWFYEELNVRSGEWKRELTEAHPVEGYMVRNVQPLYATLPPAPEPATQGAAKPVHTDHPFQHWDRTCPACVLEASPPVPNPATQGAARDMPTYGAIPWQELIDAVSEAQIGRPGLWKPQEGCYVGHAPVSMNMNSLNRIVSKFASPAPEPLTPAAGEPDERALNLLARIHRDGGHYVAEHGLHKALQDAEGIVIERIAALDEIAALTPDQAREYGLACARAALASAKEASDEWFHEDSLELVGWKYHGKGDGEGTFRLITPNDTYNPDQVTTGSMVPVYSRLPGSPVQPAVRGDAGDEP